jgi:hypothetical protein
MFSTPERTREAKPHTRWAVALGLGIVGSLIVTVIVLAFLWPTKTATPQNLPIGLAGPSAAVDAFEKAVDQEASGRIDFVAASDRQGAVDQIKTRKTYGAIVLGAPPSPTEVLTAPAGSAVATQLLTTMAAQLQAQLAQQIAAAGGDPTKAVVKVTAVVPLSNSDPTGSGMAAASFPFTLGGMLGGVLISLLVVGPLRRLAALAGFAVVAGVVLALVLQTWWEFLQGDFWVNALAIGLSVLGTSAFVVGCASLFGRAGIALGAVVTILFGSPLSAAAVPWQFLAQPWGAIGQFFVPGASNWLIRSLSYFPDADDSMQWWVLSGWAALGVILTLVGHFRSRPVMQVPAETLEHAREPVAA